MINNTLILIRVLINKLRHIWILEVVYPNKYSYSTFRSLLPESILNAKNLFIESNVLIKNINLKIGKHTYIGNDVFIDSCSSIGAFCSISSNVKIGMRNHPLDYISTSPIFYSKYRSWLRESVFDDGNIKQVVIEEDVLISSNVIIVNGVKIGRGSVIGAGAVVTKDIPPYAIVGGIPAKIIRYRFDENLISRIEKSKWWEYDDDKLKSILQYISSPTDFVNELDL